MKFNNLIALVAIISLAAQANAQDGLLRRSVAQNDSEQSVTIVNTTTSIAPVQQPATVVEAQPVSESKAEQIRKARVGAEVSTEQKIVEKLEESRLKEEQERADRLFGNKFDAAPAAAAVAAPAVTQVAAPAVTPAPVPAEKPAPAQVTIEKVEIIQPAPFEKAASDVPPPSITAVKEVKEAPVEAKSSVKAEAVDAPKKDNQFYVNGSIGAMNYEASNMKSNFAGGFAVGTTMKERISLEASFLYSNHYIDTFWNPGIYRELNQYDIGVNAKYNILTDRIRPYVGAGLSYIIRNYQQRIITSPNGYQTQTVAGPSEDQTTAINVNLMAGLNFQLNDSFMIGGGVDYSKNLTNTNSFNFGNYYAQLPANTKALEEIDFYTLKITGTLTF